MTANISSFIGKVTDVALSKVANVLSFCADRVTQAYRTARPFASGTLVKENAPPVVAQMIGMTPAAWSLLGMRWSPMGAIGAGVAFPICQYLYDKCKKAGMELDANTWIATVLLGLTITLSFHSLNDTVMVLLTPFEQYFLTLFSITVGGYVGLRMTGQDPSNPPAPWYDNYFSRNMRYIAAGQLVPLIGSVIPSATTVAHVASNVLPMPIAGPLFLSAWLIDTAASLVFGIVAGHVGYYAIPLGQAAYTALTTTLPPPSDYKNLDPNFFLKTIIKDPVSFANSLMADTPLAKVLKDHIANLVNAGIANDQIVNMIVRAINEYAQILQKPSIQAAHQELLNAIKADKHPLPSADVHAGLQILVADHRTPFTQKLHDLKAYQANLHNLPQEIFEIEGPDNDGFYDAPDPVKNLKQLMGDNSCHELIDKLYERTPSFDTIKVIIDQLIPAFEYQHELDTALAGQETLLQKLKAAKEELKPRLNVLYHQEKLNKLLYTELFGSDRLPHNLELHPLAQGALGQVLADLEQQQTVLFGAPLTNRANDQAMAHVYAQGCAVLLLTKSTALIQNPTTTPLTYDEIRQFYTHLNHLLFAPFPQAIPRWVQCFVDRVALPAALHFSEEIQRAVAGGVKVEEISDQKAASETPPEELATTHEFVVVPKGLISPTKLVKTAINAQFGNAKTLAETLVNIPMIQYLINKVVFKTIDSDVVVNAVVRSINIFAKVLKEDDNVKAAMHALSTAQPGHKAAPLKQANRAIYNHLFENKLFTMSFWEGWWTYSLKSAISQRIAPIVKVVMDQLKASGIEKELARVLNTSYDEKTLEVCIRNIILISVLMIKKGMVNTGKNRPLNNQEIDDFYENIINLAFIPFSTPLTKALKPMAQAGLPKVINENVLTPAIIQGIVDTAAQLQESKIESEFVVMDEPEIQESNKVKDPHKPFNPLRKIQRLWFRFTTAVSFWFDEWVFSLKKKKVEVAPPLQEIPVSPKPPASYAASHAPQTRHRYSLHPGKRKDPLNPPSQTQEMASPRRTLGRKRNTPGWRSARSFRRDRVGNRTYPTRKPVA